MRGGKQRRCLARRIGKMRRFRPDLDYRRRACSGRVVSSNYNEVLIRTFFFWDECWLGRILIWIETVHAAGGRSSGFLCLLSGIRGYRSIHSERLRQQTAYMPGNEEA